LEETVAPEELDEMIRSREAHTNAAILEGVSSHTKSNNILFTCSLVSDP
jgi:peptidyl-prolyl cis-trans isomerase-like 4